MAKKVSKKEVDVNAKIVEELLSKAAPSQLFGKDGLFNQGVFNKLCHLEIIFQNLIYLENKYPAEK